ncbi:MAG: YibE/F family protein [Clostridiales bacterium]|nr:YibE/F family protein [Clostridiales bacterium]
MIKKILCVFAAAAAVIFVILLNDIDFVPLINSEGKTYAKAEVTEILRDNLIEDGTRVGRQEVTVKILSGEYKGQEFTASSSSAYLYGADCRVGMRVMVTISEHNGNYTVSVAGYYRAYPVYVIIGLLFLSLYIIGGKKGVLSAVGLIFTFITIFFVYLPLIYRGYSPFLAAVISCSATTAVTLYLLGGKSVKTFAAVSGTVSGVVLAGIFAFIFCKITDISGLNVSEIDELAFIAANTKIKPGELLFSGILIASLGAVMDVAMTIASACEEINRQNPSLNSKQLFKSGMNVGKDAMGTMSNTLILAFSGSSVNMLVTLYAYNYPYMYTINLLSVGIEIIKSVSGSMAIIYTVPITALISSVIYKKIK